MRKIIRFILRKNDRIASIVKWFNRWRTVRLNKRIKRKAESLRKQTGYQVFVVKLHGNVTFLTKKQFKAMRAKKIFPKHFTADSLKRISLYYTA
jgi:hypothetical protein